MLAAAGRAVLANPIHQGPVVGVPDRDQPGHHAVGIYGGHRADVAIILANGVTLGFSVSWW
jgi:hypothetical protein